MLMLSFFALCYNATGPLSMSCLSASLVYFGQTVGWTKMPLETETGLDPRDLVLDGNPAPPLFGPCLLWRKDRPSQP